MQNEYKKKLSVSVMAHPKRAQYFDYLKQKLGDVPFLIDHNSEGIWFNAKRAWLAFDPEAEYHAVIQDDMIIGKNFYENAEKYLTEDCVYNFYMGKRP